MGNSKSTLKISGEEAEAKTKKTKSKKIKTSKSSENGDVELDTNATLPSSSVDKEPAGDTDTTAQEIEEGVRKDGQDMDTAAPPVEDDAKESGNGAISKKVEDSGTGVVKDEEQGVANGVKDPASYSVKGEEKKEVENGGGKPGPNTLEQQEKMVENGVEVSVSDTAEDKKKQSVKEVTEAAFVVEKEEKKELVEEVAATPKGSNGIVAENVHSENGEAKEVDEKVVEDGDVSEEKTGDVGNEKSLGVEVLAGHNGVHSRHKGVNGLDAEDEQVLTESSEAEPAVTVSSGSYNYDDTTNGNGDADESSRYPPRLCHLCKWPDFDGYGFNLHAEKDKPGQYIGSVDPDSPAEVGGLKENDRIIEVNGDNIESQTHSVVIQKIKSGGTKTTLLVLDRESDKYYKSRGQTVSRHMSNVIVFTTPPRDALSSDTALDRNSSPHTTEGTAAEENKEDSDSHKSEPPSYNAVEAEKAAVVEVEERVEAEHQVEESILPEPNLSLSDDEETETITATVSETVESAPAPEPDSFQNEEAEEEFPPPIEDDVAVAVAAVAIDDDDDVVAAEEEVGGGGVDMNAYEEVQVTRTTYDQDFGTASNGINGGSESFVPEPEPEPVAVPEPEPIREPEPEAAVIRSTTTAVEATPTPTPASGDLNLGLSAAEMKERLKSRKRVDPRLQKTSFEAKHKMFERM
ncbi:Na(+)/H(+) exchange regulatory cofactor NHE-RF3-like isoform X2 [Littorina saxatilis]|uniref:Na(+)/H(+) exchange regulatory cofactor NHE-RF3-like isoform X2 n=1 Tax=Littorina saxatilis TaxID=31220 RepID=UPI0038B4FC1E